MHKTAYCLEEEATLLCLFLIPYSRQMGIYLHHLGIQEHLFHFSDRATVHECTKFFLSIVVPS
jgi:hypothetical protein